MCQNEGMKRGIPDELAAEMTPAVRAFVESLLARIEELEARLNKTPRNSSRPPSSQHPHAKPPAKKPKSKRQRGGQPGHKKHERSLIPVEDCDQVVPCQPTTCRRCGAMLAGIDPSPLRHQVWELPEIKPFVTEYQRHRVTCRHCGISTCADLPPGVPERQAGPRLVALSGLLLGCFRQSKRRTALFLEQVLGQPCSPGWVVKLQQQATAALRPAYEELAAQLPTEPVLGIDETPTKQSTNKSWLWAFVAPRYSLFRVWPSRQATALTETLGSSFTGVVHCDRAKMYWSLHRLQWCWAHLKRDFQALSDHPDHQVKRLGHDLLRPTRKLFQLWARYRDGTLTRRGLKRVLRPVRDRIEALLLRGVFSGNSRLMGICRELYDRRQWLWTFMDTEGVEPTNNASERALRHAVIWRKLSFGTQSENGSRFVETILSVVETCRQQSRNVFEYLASAMQAHFSRQPTPSLLTGP